MNNNVTKKRTILVVSLFNASVNAFLAVVKVVFGIIGYSQALLADGIHSFSDLITDALVFFAANASQQYPDQEHPYGHQRIETLGTIIIALILIGVAGSISYEAIHHILQKTFNIPTTPVIIVAMISIIANEILFYYSRKQGKKIQSNLLINNAWHKRSDVFISIIVLLSVIGSMLGWHWLDAVGAIIISIFILKMAITMIWHAAQELIDRGVDKKTFEKIQSTILQVPGVQSIHQLRTRLHGQSIFVDLHIIVDPFISVSEGHHIGEEVHLNLLKKIKNLIDVTVHIDPEDDESNRPSLYLPNREKIKGILAERWEKLPAYSKIKKMTLHYLEGHLYIEIFLPHQALENVTVAQLLEQYQKAIQDIQYIASVVIHCVPSCTNLPKIKRE